MNAVRRMLAMWVTVAVLALMGSGCAYLSDRGNDALDIFDVGLTVTSEPRLAAYCGFQSLIAIGYSDVDGKMIGIGDRRVGVIDFRHNAAGIVLEGYEQLGVGSNFDLSDEDSPVKRGIGLGLIYGGYPDSFMGALNCPKFVHIGFIGCNMNCKLGELVDFLLGWTTLDIANDDRNSYQSARRRSDVTLPTLVWAEDMTLKGDDL